MLKNSVIPIPQQHTYSLQVAEDLPVLCPTCNSNPEHSAKPIQKRLHISESRLSPGRAARDATPKLAPTTCFKQSSDNRIEHVRTVAAVPSFRIYDRNTGLSWTRITVHVGSLAVHWVLLRDACHGAVIVLILSQTAKAIESIDVVGA